MTTTAAQRKAAERQRYADKGMKPRTHWIYPEDSEKLARYVKRLNERAERRRAG